MKGVLILLVAIATVVHCSTFKHIKNVSPHPSSAEYTCTSMGMELANIAVANKLEVVKLLRNQNIPCVWVKSVDGIENGENSFWFISQSGFTWKKYVKPFSNEPERVEYHSSKCSALCEGEEDTSDDSPEYPSSEITEHSATPLDSEDPETETISSLKSESSESENEKKYHRMALISFIAQEQRWGKRH
jgi:hypothetical protein